MVTHTHTHTDSDTHSILLPFVMHCVCCCAVLSDEQKRAVYDIYGEKGLSAGDEVCIDKHKQGWWRGRHWVPTSSHTKHPPTTLIQLCFTVSPSPLCRIQLAPFYNTVAEVWLAPKWHGSSKEHALHVRMCVDEWMCGCVRMCLWMCVDVSKCG